MRKQHALIFLSSLLALLIVALVMLLFNAPKPQSVFDSKEPFGVDFTLTDQNGRERSRAEFDNKYKLIFFGFTFCPAICPTELQKITEALDGLGDKRSNIQPLFITIDPARDTPAVMKDFLSNFDDSIIGLTGTQEDIDVVVKGYKIYASKADRSDAENYLMDHSAFIYFLAPDNRLLKIYRTEDNAKFMAQDIATLLQ